MNETNFIAKLFVDAINAMCEPGWEWPETWSNAKKLSFLNASIRYAENPELELYEQCVILKKIQDQFNA